MKTVQKTWQKISKSEHANKFGHPHPNPPPFFTQATTRRSYVSVFYKSLQAIEQFLYTILAAAPQRNTQYY